MASHAVPGVLLLQLLYMLKSTLYTVMILDARQVCVSV